MAKNEKSTDNISIESDTYNSKHSDIEKENIFAHIKIRGARENNLKNIDIDIPKNKFVVITGPSGSGKSSLAFDTIYKEGQRRYVESLSNNIKFFLGSQDKPDVDKIEGLNPTLAIDQKTTSKSPRSTVGTITEIYDYIRLLFSRIGKVYSPKTGERLIKYSKNRIIALISLLPKGTKFRILTPFVRGEKGTLSKELSQIKQQGFDKARIDGKFISLEEIPELNPDLEHTIEIVIDRIIMKENISDRIYNSVEKCLKVSVSNVILDIVELPNEKKEIILDGVKIKVGEFFTFSTQYADPNSSFTLENIEPKMFSFNSAYGACQACHGLGTEIFFKESLIIPDENKTLLEGAIEPWGRDNTRYHNQLLEGLSKKFNFSLDIPYKDLPDNIKKIILYGTEEEIEIEKEENMRYSKNKVIFNGVIGELNAKLESAQDDPIVLDELEKYQTLIKCHHCNGFRLKNNVLQVKINDKNIGEVCSLSIIECKEWFENLKNNLLKDEALISETIVNEVISRLNYLINVGLDYLTLIRSSNTLSGGEAQRIRLSTQIGSGLCGVIYVLDEPSIGLHQSDNNKLINTLKQLRDLGNSVIVIEHDEETMRSADYLIDVGPGAGIYGGEITAKGKIEGIIKNPTSLTGMFLSGNMAIKTPKARRKFGNSEYIELLGASENNLKNVNVKIPLGKFIAVSGVSGGGKSTLILDTLYLAIAQKLNRSQIRPGKFKEIKGLQNIDKIIKIDQEPIGRTPRSSPATYTGLFTMIRDLFAIQPLSMSRGYKSSRFSFNVKGGRCENCQGDGVVCTEMSFLPDVYVKCSVCNGRRYNKETLDVKYCGYSIDEVLNMSVREAIDVFKDEPIIKEKLYSLYNVGLDYIKIGQSAVTLSGGEAQRIKLAKELSRKATGNTLYILDEPTTGLHSCDIERLLKVLHTLVDYGNTVIVIEHNLDVIKTADHVIDIGPKGGKDGGYIVAEGTPEEVAENKNSVTGKYLKKVL